MKNFSAAHESEVSSPHGGNSREPAPLPETRLGSPRRKILVIDDSQMLLGFVQQILHDANYEVITAANGQEGFDAAVSQSPDLVLLDFLLPDIRGDEVSRRLAAEQNTAALPVLYMSGAGGELDNAQKSSPNVLGIIRKPFAATSLLETVAQHLPKPTFTSASGSAASQPGERMGVDALEPEAAGIDATSGNSTVGDGRERPTGDYSRPEFVSQAAAEHSPETQHDAPKAPFFAGDTNFFSLTWALRTIAKEKLTGSLRCFGLNEPVELLARDGAVVLATTRDPQFYSPETPVALVDVDAQQVEHARQKQAQTACPVFITLSQENLIPKEPALQLVQHHGVKIFAQLWTAPRVRFAFEQTARLPEFAEGVPVEPNIDDWLLETVRFVQVQELGDKINYDPSWIPAYTRDGFQRVQILHLTGAEAQFASQFNGGRSIAQIARNLRIDLKSARLTLFRFLSLEIIECWPPAPAEKEERPGVWKRLGRSIGIGE